MTEQLADKLLARLEEAESMIGSSLTRMAMDQVDPSHRKRWLKSTRELLIEAGRPVENLTGLWHTELEVKNGEG